jgi:hypothetical protein
MPSGNRNLNALATNLVVQHNVPAARPTLVSDGISLAAWKTNAAFSATNAVVLIDGSAASTLNSPTGGAGGAEIWGYIAGGVNQWFRIGYLNDGANVDIASDTQGYAQQIAGAAVFDRLCVCGTPSAGAFTARFIPIETWS